MCNMDYLELPIVLRGDERDGVVSQSKSTWRNARDAPLVCDFPLIGNLSEQRAMAITDRNLTYLSRYFSTQESTGPLQPGHSLVADSLGRVVVVA